MKIRLFNNEKGFTLAELLAALSLFAAVIALSSAVIVQLTNSEKAANGSITIRQDMNVLINQLRSQYADSKTPLCINEDTANFTFSDVTNGHITDNCIEIENKDKPVSFTLITSDDQGEDFSIRTAFNKSDEYVIDITQKAEVDPEDYNPGDMNNNHQCVFEGNTKFTATTLKNKKNEECQNKYTVNGSAAFLEDLTIHNKVLLEVTGDLHIYGKETFKGVKGTICVHNNVFPEDILDNHKVLEDADSCEVRKDAAIILMRNVSQ